MDSGLAESYSRVPIYFEARRSAAGSIVVNHPRRVALWGVLLAVVGYLTLIGAPPVNWVMYLSIALLIVGATVGFT